MHLFLFYLFILIRTKNSSRRFVSKHSLLSRHFEFKRARIAELNVQLLNLLLPKSVCGRFIYLFILHSMFGGISEMTQSYVNKIVEIKFSKFRGLL